MSAHDGIFRRRVGGVYGLFSLPRVGQPAGIPIQELAVWSGHSPAGDSSEPKMDVATSLDHCRKEKPTYMVPEHIELRNEMSGNPNGKIDRARITMQYKEHFSEVKS